jgi:hypothetical protein
MKGRAASAWDGRARQAAAEVLHRVVPGLQNAEPLGAE